VPRSAASSSETRPVVLAGRPCLGLLFPLSIADRRVILFGLCSNPPA
jgi:hypothetical protein